MLDPIQMDLRIIRLGCSHFTIEHRSYHFVCLQGINVIQIVLFAFCDLASVLVFRSQSRNQCDPDFSVRILRSNISATNSFAFKEPSPPNFFSNRGEPVRRGDHFWVRSKVELKLEALARHPRTLKERIRVPRNVFFFFYVFFSCFVFLYPF